MKSTPVSMEDTTMPAPVMPSAQTWSAPILATPHSGSPAAARIAVLIATGFTSG